MNSWMASTNWGTLLKTPRRIRLRVISPNQRSLQIQPGASTDLSNWMVLGNAASLTNGLYLYLDLDATNYPFRYYRVRSP